MPKNIGNLITKDTSFIFIYSCHRKRQFVKKNSYSIIL